MRTLKEIEKDIEKPIYLLNEIIKNNIQEVCVCESQINALTCWEYGVPAIATFGCNITSKQFEILNKSGIFVYNLLFDGDDAGDKGIARFIKNIRKDVIVNVVPMPRGKDVNDLEKEEFLDLLKNYTKQLDKKKFGLYNINDEKIIERTKTNYGKIQNHSHGNDNRGQGD